MFPRADFPWICRLQTDARALEFWEHYELKQTVHFDPEGRGEPCGSKRYWDQLRSLPRAWPERPSTAPPPDLTEAVLDCVARSFGGRPASPLLAAPRQQADSVSPIHLDTLELWLPSVSVCEGGLIVLRDDTGQVGLLDLRPVTSAEVLRPLLAHAYPDVELRVLDDHSTYRATRVVPRVRAPELECTLDEAREVNIDVSLGDEVFWPIPIPWAPLLLRWIAHPSPAHHTAVH